SPKHRKVSTSKPQSRSMIGPLARVSMTRSTQPASFVGTAIPCIESTGHVQTSRLLPRKITTSAVHSSIFKNAIKSEDSYSITSALSQKKQGRSHVTAHRSRFKATELRGMLAVDFCRWARSD